MKGHTNTETQTEQSIQKLDSEKGNITKFGHVFIIKYIIGYPSLSTTAPS